MSATEEPRCTVCGRPSEGRMYCSARCKQRAYRKRRREETRPPLRLVATEVDAEEDAAEVGRRIEHLCVTCLLQAVESAGITTPARLYDLRSTFASMGSPAV